MRGISFHFAERLTEEPEGCTAGSERSVPGSGSTTITVQNSSGLDTNGRYVLLTPKTLRFKLFLFFMLGWFTGGSVMFLAVVLYV